VRERWPSLFVSFILGFTLETPSVKKLVLSLSLSDELKRTLERLFDNKNRIRRIVLRVKLHYQIYVEGKSKGVFGWWI
jgi:hypothetical protein